MTFFDSTPLAPTDPIFGLIEAFIADPRPGKVNVGVGAYKTEELKPWVLPSVRQAEQEMYASGLNKEYLPIPGDASFLTAASGLVFGALSKELQVFAAQAVGGTGALNLGGKFLFEHVTRDICIPTPTWDNHERLFKAVGMKVSTYSYYDPEIQGISFENMIEVIRGLPKKSCILLHACCHNPTGCDLSIEQWKEVAKILQQKEIFPFFDMAYQGFGDDLEKDAFAVRYFAEQGISFFTAYSFSKNFGLYNERVGALFAVCQNKDEAQRVGSQLRLIIRSIYSNPPAHGAKIVSTILNSDRLKPLWIQELQTMRQRILKMRCAFAQQLGELSPLLSASMQNILKQKGMFSFTGLTPSTVEKLKKEYAIYLPSNGRLSFVGLNENNLPYVVKAIADSTSISKRMS